MQRNNIQSTILVLFSLFNVCQSQVLVNQACARGEWAQCDANSWQPCFTCLVNHYEVEGARREYDQINPNANCLPDNEPGCVNFGKMQFLKSSLKYICDKDGENCGICFNECTLSCGVPPFQDQEVIDASKAAEYVSSGVLNFNNLPLGVGGEYSYQTKFRSWAGFGYTTTNWVKDGKVIARKRQNLYSFGEGENWIETAEDVGSHGDKYRTAPEQILSCANALSPENDDNDRKITLTESLQTQYYSGEGDNMKLTIDSSQMQNPFGVYFMDGCIPIMCYITELGCADDCSADYSLQNLKLNDPFVAVESPCEHVTCLEIDCLEGWEKVKVREGDCCPEYSCERKTINGNFNEVKETILLGDDADEFGCKPSAGMVWCEPMQKCIFVSESCSNDMDENIEYEMMSMKSSENSFEVPDSLPGFSDIKATNNEGIEKIDTLPSRFIPVFDTEEIDHQALPRFLPEDRDEEVASLIPPECTEDDFSNICQPRTCIDGKYATMVIDCAAFMNPGSCAGEWIPVDGECCPKCVDDEPECTEDDLSNICEPKTCVDGKYITLVIDCAAFMSPELCDGEWVPVEGECCPICVKKEAECTDDDLSDICEPQICVDGKYETEIIECEEFTMPNSCSEGTWIPQPDECCSICVPQVPEGLCLEQNCFGEGACLMIEDLEAGEYTCEVDPVHFTSRDACLNEIGFWCEDAEPECTEDDRSHPCEPKICVNGVYTLAVVDCQEFMLPNSCDGIWAPPGVGECCSTCVLPTPEDKCAKTTCVLSTCPDGSPIPKQHPDDCCGDFALCPPECTEDDVSDPCSPRECIHGHYVESSADCMEDFFPESCIGLWVKVLETDCCATCISQENNVDAISDIVMSDVKTESMDAPDSEAIILKSRHRAEHTRSHPENWMRIEEAKSLEACPIPGQKRRSCATPCPLTCSEPHPRQCTKNCIVGGCQCERGMVLDEINNVCVFQNQCPGAEDFVFPPPDKCKPVVCRMGCPNGWAKGADGCDICRCKRPTPQQSVARFPMSPGLQIDNLMKEPCTGAEGLVRRRCGTSCPDTCGQTEPMMCTMECRIAVCQCPPGLYLDKKQYKCVEKLECTDPVLNSALPMPKPNRENVVPVPTQLRKARESSEEVNSETGVVEDLSNVINTHNEEEGPSVGFFFYGFMISSVLIVCLSATSIYYCAKEDEKFICTTDHFVAGSAYSSRTKDNAFIPGHGDILLDDHNVYHISEGQNDESLI